MKREYLFGVLGGILLGTACAGVPKPTAQLVSAQAALRAADEVGAAKIPKAELHAQLAKEQIARANKLIEDGNNAEAERVLLRAKADAELAVALSRKADAAHELDHAQSMAGSPSGSANAVSARNP